MVTNDPSKHPLLSEKEIIYIKANIIINDKQNIKKVPWKKILANKSIWIGSFTSFSISLSLQTITLKFPNYMYRVLRIPLERIGIYISAMHIAECTG